MRITVRLLIAFVLAVATSSLYATTYIVPADRDLVRRSEGIVIATALESHSQYTTDGRIVTIATLALDEVLKGELGGQSSIDLIEAGGFVGDRATVIPGSPRYAAGTQYMVFLRRTTDGWATYGFSLGKFEFVSDLLGRQLLTRGGSDEIFGWDEMTNTSHVETLRDATAFQTFVRTVMTSADAPARADYFVDRGAVVLQSQLSFTPKPLAGVTRPDYLLTGNSRWQSPTANFDYCCSPFTVPGGLDGPGAIGAGTGNWTSAGAGVHYGVGSPNPSATHGLVSADGINAVLFNDPSGQIPAGVAAAGGISAGIGTYTLSDGFTYFNTTEVDVVVGNNFSTNQATFNGLMTHEIGHTLGFRHSNEGPTFGSQCTGPCSSSAIMNSTVAFNQQTLLQWDLDAAQTVYGSGPVCTAPSITTQPASQSIAFGAQATLTVAASGSGTLTFQWYIGSSPTTTTPVGGATSTTFHPTPSTTTSYWVRVTGQCAPTADSTTAVVTVTCASPSAASGPTASPSTITVGSSSTLSVVAGGTGPFTYQWFIGNTGVTTTPITGATGSSTSVSPAATTSYWVRITGQCGSFDSPAVPLTVVACVQPSITGQPADQQITAGGSAALNVSATGTALLYQWFIGNPGDLSSPVSSPSANSFVFVNPVSTTTYWVRVTGQCGTAVNSNPVTVTVTQACVSAAIGTQPASASIAQGGSMTLTVVASGTSPIAYQWFIGSSGDFSSPIQGATTTQVTVTPSATTSYWVRVSNSCGSANSNTATVTVSTCASPSITTQPANVSAAIGTAATLKVVAGGTGPHYQWYQGAKGDTTKKVGTDSATLVTGGISGTTTYWVRVTGTCGNPADSNAATVTATAPPRGRAARH